MKKEQLFGSAVWIAASVDDIESAIVIRRGFKASDVKSARLRVIGFGTFVAYMNGERISDDYFLPMNSEYEKCALPEGEELFGFRTYVTEYDITDAVRDGENLFALHVGGGWYDGIRHYDIQKIYGEKKAIYAIDITSSDGTVTSFVSDGSERWHRSYVVKTDINRGEAFDYTGWSDEYLSLGFDDSEWDLVKHSKPVKTEYELTDCPADKVMGTLTVKEVFVAPDYKILDCGMNTSGYPLVKIKEGYFGKVRVTFSEGLDPSGKDIDEKHVFEQELNITADGVARVAYPQFTWYGFRYMRVVGECEIDEVKVVHANVDVSSSFECSDEVLNWTYNAFIYTQLTNMHRGIPSDCPHIERLGYTGDGQHVCRSALLTLDAKKFYKKWIMDISDCQDKLTGRIQYTAPHMLCGGGPGGWGSAIVIVPYEYYKYYGDAEPLRKLYPQMLHFLRFLADNSASDLVVSYKKVNGKETRWCLGDWASSMGAELPTPYVNTYFRILSTKRVIEIARVIGKEEDIPRLEEEIAACARAIDTFYRNNFVRDDCYCANVRGANAFALDIGLGSDITRDKLVDYYDDLGCYDTGIFATEIVTRVLFKVGRGDVAYKLLTATEPRGFGKWWKDGSTTLREYFGTKCRSYSHPMFGAVVADFFEYILGIRQREGTAAYSDVVIDPVKLDALTFAKGHITTPKGRIAVSFTTDGGARTYTIEIPEGIKAVLVKDGEEIVLTAGKNVI